MGKAVNLPLPDLAAQNRVVAVHLYRLPLECVFGDLSSARRRARPARARPAAPSRTERPCAVSSDIRGRAVLIEVSWSARAKGVCPGMSVTEARARLPEIEVKKRDLKKERERLETAAELLFAYGPIVEVAVPAFLFVEIGGSTRVLERALASGAKPESGSLEEKLAEHLIHALESRGHEATVAIAKDPIIARTLASHLSSERRRQPALRAVRNAVVVPRGHDQHALEQLPIESLLWTDALDDPDGLERERLRAVHASLRVLGIHEVARLKTLPSAQVSSRFGEAGAVMMDRAYARIDRPLRPFTPPSRIIEALELESPIEDLEPILFVMKRLLSRIEARLEARSLSASAVRLTFDVEPGLDRAIDSASARAKSSRHQVDLTISLARPTRRASTLLTLCREKLQGALPGLVREVAVEALSPAIDHGAQLDLFTSYAKKVEEVSELVGRLKAALGDDAVFSPEVSDAHRPEAAWTTRPFEIERAFATPREERRTKNDLALGAAGLARDGSKHEAYILPEVEESLRVAEMPIGADSIDSGHSAESALAELERKKRFWPKAIKRTVEDEPLPALPPRPLELFDPPEAATLIAIARAERADRAERAHRSSPEAGILAWRGERLALARLSGCERLQAEWWTAAPLEREYVVAEVDDGRSLWLFFEPSGELFVHGAFD